MLYPGQTSVAMSSAGSGSAFGMELTDELVSSPEPARDFVIPSISVTPPTPRRWSVTPSPAPSLCRDEAGSSTTSSSPNRTDSGTQFFSMLPPMAPSEVRTPSPNMAAGVTYTQETSSLSPWPPHLPGNHRGGFRGHHSHPMAAPPQLSRTHLAPFDQGGIHSPGLASTYQGRAIRGQGGGSLSAGVNSHAVRNLSVSFGAEGNDQADWMCYRQQQQQLQLPYGGSAAGYHHQMPPFYQSESFGGTARFDHGRQPYYPQVPPGYEEWASGQVGAPSSTGVAFGFGSGAGEAAVAASSGLSPRIRGPFKPGRECKFCKNNGESPDSYRSHVLRNPGTGQLICPVLRDHTCEVCGATGDDAHTKSYCPQAKKEQKKSLPTMLKETKRQSDGTLRRGGKQ